MADFYELSALQDVDPSEISLPRLAKLLPVVRAVSNVTLLKVMASPAGATERRECLVVDVRCDDVPNRNVPGIRYVERLAIVEPEQPDARLDVRVLRKDFPALMHMNQRLPGEPGSLCLYNEDERAVRRTWTPQNFLRRIEWWLIQSARESLHPADQPVEQLFFVTKFELIVSPDFPATPEEASGRYLLHKLAERKGGAQTFALVPAGADAAASLFNLAITLPPIVHGVVELTPGSLGMLADLLQARGADLVTPLRHALSELVPEGKGMGRPKQRRLVSLLLTTPIARAEGEQPSAHDLRAYMLDVDVFDLALQLDACIEYDGSLFRATGVDPDPALEQKWRAHHIFPFEVLRSPSRDTLRDFSGIADEGPKGTIVGAGSLGSAILHLWSRQGWGEWTVIDKDHIRPHNLARHIAYDANCGIPKADVVAGLLNGAVPHGAQVTPIVEDINPLTADRAKGLFGESEVVIDVSTDLDFPRSSSFIDGLPRLASAFVTPDGAASVLLVESADRALRLRSLESQYYRALLAEEWGASLYGNVPRKLWSGASCRDISLVLSYAKVSLHAANLAEQIPACLQNPAPRILIWQRHAAGEMKVHEIATGAEEIKRIGSYQVSIDAQLLVQLRAMRTACLPNETGGILLGYHDFNQSMIVIVQALPAPPDSISTSNSFIRGTVGCLQAVEEAARRTAGVVVYVGEWHSHPKGHSARPSNTDINQITSLAQSMAEDGLPVLQLIVGDGDYSIMQMQIQH